MSAIQPNKTHYTILSNILYKYAIKRSFTIQESV